MVWPETIVQEVMTFSSFRTFHLCPPKEFTTISRPTTISAQNVSSQYKTAPSTSTDVKTAVTGSSNSLVAVVAAAVSGKLLRSMFPSLIGSFLPVSGFLLQ